MKIFLIIFEKLMLPYFCTVFNRFVMKKKLIEPLLEKKPFLHMQKERLGKCTAEQRLCFPYIHVDSTIPLLHKPEISSL